MTPAVKVDTVRPGDRAAVLDLFVACSPETVLRRFFAPLRALPRPYLDGVLAGRPAVHDAVVLRYGDGLHIAGLASLVAAPGDRWSTELGVLVADAWQGRGVGRALVAALVDRAVSRGVGELTASVLPGRAGLLRALGRRLELIEVVGESDYVTGRFRLPEEMTSR